MPKNEWIVLIFVSIVLFIGLYYLLRYFNTDQLFISTLSMLVSLIATYLVVRRSKFGFLFYISSDIIVFILWVIPVIQGNFVLIPMLIDPIIDFISDFYGWVNWNKKKNSEG